MHQHTKDWIGFLTRSDITTAQKVERFAELVNRAKEGTKESLIPLKELFGILGNGNIDEELIAAKEQFNEMVKQLEAGPLRIASCLAHLPAEKGRTVPKVECILEDGQTAQCVVMKGHTYECGDRILVDTKGKVVIGQSIAPSTIGLQAELLRVIDGSSIEVKTSRGDNQVLWMAKKLADRITSKEVAPGDMVLFNERQSMAFDALPKQDGLAHFKFLARECVPDVIVERDIGNPPHCISQLDKLVHAEMTRPEVRRRYGLRRTSMKLLAGVSGSGKTLAIQAVWRNTYEAMSRVTGVPVAELPPRVFRLRMAKVLSMWLGESDKHLDRFFDEVEQMADEKFEGHTLPVIAIMEEIDGLAKQRGTDNDGIFDRILTTALQRLDSTRPELKEKLIIFIGTTNNPHAVDRAFLRRIGGSIEYFGRLDEAGFRAVLDKHIAKIPLTETKSNTGDAIQHLFFNGSRPIVELGYAGREGKEPKYPRDLLTGAIVDQSVQQAAGVAVEGELAGKSVGVSIDMLTDAFAEQIENVADQLTEQNATHFLDLPSGVRVANLRRL